MEPKTKPVLFLVAEKIDPRPNEEAMARGCFALLGSMAAERSTGGTSCAFMGVLGGAWRPEFRGETGGEIGGEIGGQVGSPRETCCWN